ncbi:hypothetical protein C2E23DRAFT_855118 [Lenzites betulinus]|nr:hypothetical protein C2E23DRAFT_855118 [Lenzites betulinus]
MSLSISPKALRPCGPTAHAHIDRLYRGLCAFLRTGTRWGGSTLTLFLICAALHSPRPRTLARPA